MSKILGCLGQNQSSLPSSPTWLLDSTPTTLFPKNQSLLQRRKICQTCKYSQEYATGSEDNLKRRIPERYGATATPMEASKDDIYPKVTTSKRVKSTYTVNLIFVFLIQQQQLKSFLSWLSMLSKRGVNTPHGECPRSRCWRQSYKWHHIPTKSMPFNLGLLPWL